MCRFKSGIILKDRIVVAQGENDSHSDLLETLGIKDDYIGASKTFVRTELVPKNDEWWESPEEHPEKWEFTVDQDIVPEWFEKERAEEEFREAVCRWWKDHVMVDKKDVKVLLDNSQVRKMWNSSQVRKMWNSSQVGEMHGSSQVGEMYDSSQVGEMYGGSQVGEMYDSSQVGKMCGSSQVREMWNSSQVGKMYDSSTARDFKKYPLVRIMIPENGKFEMVVFKNKED